MASSIGLRLLGLLLRLLVAQCQLVGNVVLVGVANIVDRFLADVLGHHQLDVAKPLIRIEALSAASLRSLAIRFGPAL